MLKKVKVKPVTFGSPDSQMAWALTGNKQHHPLCEMQPWGAAMFGDDAAFCDCGAEPKRAKPRKAPPAVSR